MKENRLIYATKKSSGASLLGKGSGLPSGYNTYASKVARGEIGGGGSTTVAGKTYSTDAGNKALADAIAKNGGVADTGTVASAAGVKTKTVTYVNKFGEEYQVQTTDLNSPDRVGFVNAKPATETSQQTYSDVIVKPSGSTETLAQPGTQPPIVLPDVNSTPQSTVGLQTTSNALGAQVTGPTVPISTPAAPQGTLPTGFQDQFGLGGIYQPSYDILGQRQNVLQDQFQTNLDQINKNYKDFFDTLNKQEEQAASGLEYDAETGTFTALSSKEESRIRSPYDEAIAAQNLQKESQLTDLSFAKSESLSALDTQRSEQEALNKKQQLARETFAGLAGAFGSSRTFEYLQQEEQDGQDLLAKIDEKKASYSQYYSDKMSQVQDTYQLNVTSLQRQLAQTMNDRYDELLNKVDEIRTQKASGLNQQLLDIRTAVNDYNSSATDIAGQAANIMAEYKKAVYDAEQQAVAEDKALRDTIGQAILSTYDTLVPGFVPSSGKVAEFTNTIYQGLKLYEQTGGQQGYANLQSGVADLMNAIQSNSAVFARYNPYVGGGSSGGGSGSSGGGTITDDQIKSIFLSKGINPTSTQLKNARALINYNISNNSYIDLLGTGTALPQGGATGAGTPLAMAADMIEKTISGMIKSPTENPY